MKIIGIDLGTTTSEIAYIKDGKPEIICNLEDKRITPSVIGVTDDGEYIVGEFAKRQIALKPDKTVSEVKALIGTNEKVLLGGKNYFPQELSAILLKHLKSAAEKHLNEEVEGAVITVPANFNSLQRQATKIAGELAGFKVERIINEPTAAAMAYGLNNLENDEKVLVYDLGGGTFDVSVLELFSGILDVKASRGNNKLGGKDFDQRIIDYIVEDFEKNYHIDLSANVGAMARIKEASEKAKIELSNSEITEINLPFIAIDENQNPIGINLVLTRNKMEELIEDLVNSTEITINEALEASGYADEDINVVLAVGGSSKMFCVRNLLQKRFGNKVRFDINPDEAVALGAAVQAGIIKDEINSEDSLIVTDNCQYTLGISVIEHGNYGRVYDGVFDPLIKRDTKIPCTVKKTYYTSYDYQTQISIEVYEGISRLVKENTLIGSVILDGIPSALSGQEPVDITFSYNLNGILEVRGQVISTGKYASATFDLKGLKDSHLAIPDFNINSSNNTGKDAWKNYKLAKEVQLSIELAEKKLEVLSVDEKIDIGLVLNKLKQAVIDNDIELVKEYDKKLTDMIFNLG
ncbi:Hsp70 family protein [Desnuesiella massiliensis]|uniref:Hsp70 family protein n=1 Tax=Desnuesiella massiliensis TaxID=1650662 RepID=UPI0006E3B748|nr:Hsp70 family protein [Desnuesiella massiliensis]